MAKFTHNTEDWELHACLDWARKWKTVDCDQCGGTGTQPRGLKESYYGDEIIDAGYYRSVWKCSKCSKMKYEEHMP